MNNQQWDQSGNNFILQKFPWNWFEVEKSFPLEGEKNRILFWSESHVRIQTYADYFVFEVKIESHFEIDFKLDVSRIKQTLFLQ